MQMPRQGSPCGSTTSIPKELNMLDAVIRAVPWFAERSAATTLALNIFTQ